MPAFRISGLPDRLSEEVRQTRRSPGYGHPAICETAQGTGPCRSCLCLFEIGRDERLLFTYGPSSGTETVAAPGPVYIHAAACPRYDATRIPEALLELPLLLEGRTNDGRVLRSVSASGKEQVTEALHQLLAHREIEFLFLRHGEAGCHIARIDRDTGSAV